MTPLTEEDAVEGERYSDTRSKPIAQEHGVRMDAVIARRRPLNATGVPFRCPCGTVIAWWDMSLPYQETVGCGRCVGPTYTLLRSAITSNGRDREWVIRATGIGPLDVAAIVAQGFHLHPAGGAMDMLADHHRDFTTDTGEFSFG